MKVQLMFLLGVILLPGFGMDMDAYRNGAKAKIVYRVVDDEGAPVVNARAQIWFRTDYPKLEVRDWVLSTNTNGEFVAEGKTNERVSIGVDKEGYYHTFDRVTFRSGTGEYKVVDGKWQPYGETRTVVLRKVVNPVACIPFGRNLRDAAIPAFGRWLGFDLEKGNWIQPWGGGTHADILLRFSSHEANAYKDYRYVMEVSFTNNPFAGAYRLGLDSHSDLKTLHEANSNGNYQAYFNFFSETVPGRGRSSFVLDDSSYLVYRTRTSVDDEGRLVSAHYGTIIGGWLFDSKGVTFTDGCFNPVANSVSIEGGRYLLGLESVKDLKGNLK